ncbi:MAG: hypothetical protein Q8Q76_00770 [Methylotenera sp.]|nr:hypothetical protein [Methylotenera sp.]
MVLILLVFIIALASTALLLKSYNPVSLRVQQAKKTEQSLASAKQALLAYAAKPITAPPSSTALTCNDNCPRPGDMPCPDMDNYGEAAASCSANQIGRLPWKTLGTDDLRDGAGERLWYSVSEQYKNNPRLLPLNSDSKGTISLRDSQGNLLYDATGTTGLAAVVMAPGEVLTRGDGLVQSRTAANQNSANHYLDIVYGEDNASLTEGSTDGFISGMVNNAGQKLLNDVVLPITRDEVIAVMEPRVLEEVAQAMRYYYSVKSYYPDPASITDTTCLTIVTILNDATNAKCTTSTANSFGRIPVGAVTMPPSSDIWAVEDSNSILRGERAHNWFQQNGWRELILYAVAPACTLTNLNCTGVGYLTLNNSITPFSAPMPNNKQVVLIASGKALTLTGQTRTDSTDKSLFSNYLEDSENLNLDNIFNRHTLDASKNDRLISTP